MSADRFTGNEIAIVGMAGRFPGARDLEELWANLRGGAAAMRRLSEAELDALGVAPEVYRDPSWVPVVSQMEGFADFAADFFGINPREAETMDPQHRVLLELAWEALESAGYVPDGLPGAAGIFAGATLSTYLVYQLARNRRIAREIDPFQLILGNAGDALTTRISYKLNLKGPSCAVQSACSTSLVAVHLACQSLLQEECDLALAGGVSVNLAHAAGYRYVEGSILSPDGRCRSFDAAGRGTPFGSGAGLVVLKRLQDALAAGDTVRAVILGSAMNNDGAQKVGFTAPGVDGQARVIAEALAVSGADPETIRYLEAHGSGTPLGDPVEVQAVTRAFRRFTEARGFCAMGSIKSNLGHLDTAAGVAGLIKTVLALENGWIPPSLGFETPNPKIDFAAAPVFVAARLQPWPEAPRPRRAGVNSFGAGGTNAHVVLEEAPAAEPAGEPRPWQLLALSAQSAGALDAATWALADHLRRHPGLHPEDVAHTLHQGRKAFARRRVAVCRGLEEAAAALESLDPTRVWTDAVPEEQGEPPVVFLLPGLGEHFVDMGLGLYQSEPAFRDALDRCAGLLLPELGVDVREILYPRGVASAEKTEGGEGLDLRRLLGRADRSGDDARRLDETRFAQPALFAVEHSLAQLFLSWGVRPAALLGYSAGEYVAACLAGVFSLEDALKLVARRALWIDELPRGAMTAVPLPAGELGERLCRHGLFLAAQNGHALSVVSGREEDVAALERELAESGVASRRLPTAHAFHSPLLVPVEERLTALAASLERRPPRIPFLSNVTGTWITAAEALDPGYWARHMCGPVRFAAAVDELLSDAGRVCLEVGPGQGLGSLLRLHPAGGGRAGHAIPALPDPRSAQASQQVALAALGRLWLAGARPDHDAFYAGRRRRRVPLPTYRFERRRFWVEADRGAAETADALRLAPPPPAAAQGHQRPARVRGSYAAPEGEIEKAVAGMWEDLLGIAQVGRGDSFYDLGGHSLLATQLASRMRELFAVELQVGHLLEEPTVAAMAAAVRRRRETAPPAGGTAGAPRLERRRPAGDRAPLSFSQERMWFLCQLDPQTVSYHIFFAVRMLGELDRAALAAAWSELVRRHESLRTTFVREGGGPVQVIGPPRPVALPLADLAGLPAAARQAEVRRLSAVEQHTPFDYERGPLLRVHLLRESAEDHVVLMTTHHLVGDGWSLLVLVREMAALYDAFAAGRPSPLPEPPIQYADFAVWQRRHLRGEVLDELLAYWRRQLADPPPPLHLATDRPRAGAGFLGGWAYRALEPGLEQRVRAAGAAAGASPFMILTAAFQALLYRHSGSADIVLGAPIAGRNYSELEGLIGVFLNTLPLRLRLDPRQGFGELAARVRQVTLAAYNHQDVPLELLLETAVERKPGLGSLFQAMILHQNVPIPEMELSGVSLRPLPDQDVPDLGADPFDVCLVVEEEEGLRLALLYNTNLFEPATAQALVERLHTLLAAGLAEPGRPVGELPLLSAEERLQLAAWSGAAQAEPAAEVTVLDLFAAQAARAPGAPAVVGESSTLTYGELDRRSDRLASRLRRLGAGPETAVGLCVERSPESLVAVLGILKSGGAYVPLDPAHPAERMAAVLADARALAVVASPGLAGRFTGITGMPVLDPAAPDGDSVAEPDPERLAPLAGDRRTAYILYTSGSTGVPKGVAVEHRSLARFTLAARQSFALAPGDRVLQFAALTFDASGEEIFPALAAGAALVLRDDEMLASAAAFLAFCRARGVTVADLPTAWWHQLTAALAAEELAVGAPLRLLILGGERALPEKLLAFERRLDPAVRLLNTYGPTETTIAVTSWELPWGTAAGLAGREVPIGRPYPHVRIWVLDAAGEPAPPGFPGELHVGGEAPARGYLGRPDLTAASFVPDPFSGVPGARLYRTGDLARFLPGGRLEYLGRIDRQVKIRGFRVEPGEVEAVLRRHPAIADAAVAVREDTPGERRLVAYVVAPEAPDLAGLQDFLAARVPEPMLPAAWVHLERLPLNASGKLDRSALPAPSAALRSGRPYVAPRTPAEELLAGLFGEVLGVERVSVEDSYFALGGHSLSLVQLLHRVRETFQVEISLRTLYDDPTVAGLAEAVEELILEDINAPG